MWTAALRDAVLGGPFLHFSSYFFFEMRNYCRVEYSLSREWLQRICSEEPDSIITELKAPNATCTPTQPQFGQELI